MLLPGGHYSYVFSGSMYSYILRHVFFFFFDEFFYNILVAGVLKLLLISMMFCFPFISCMKSIFVEL